MNGESCFLVLCVRGISKKTAQKGGICAAQPFGVSDEEQ